MASNRAKHSKNAALLIATVATLGAVTTTATATADPNVQDPNCLQGYHQRLATPGDGICVPVEHYSIAQFQNALAAQNRDPNGGPYGPDTCKQGYVWRDAETGDHVCVPPEGRDMAAQDNTNFANGVGTPLR
jgi:hypothetical protein